ncbi:MAG TPA: cytochrome c [Rhodanobacteraceae bacterium]
MKRWFKHGLWAVPALAVVATGLWLVSPQGNGEPARAGAFAQVPLTDPALIAKGKYLAAAGDCAACHTARNGKPYAGGRAVPTPFGDVYVPNITPDKTTGIGAWSFDDFWRALHLGKGKAGQYLYPVFPYTSYTKVTREDARAIFAYLHSLPAVNRPDQAPQLDFPYNVRSALALWRGLNFDAGTYRPDPEKSAQWNRGAYLVQGLGHCVECHTTRSWTGGYADGKTLVGGTIPGQHWYAPDLSMAKGGGLASWSEDDLVDLLKTGLSRRGAVFGPMANVVRESTQYMTRDDLKAMAVYLQSLPPRPAAQDKPFARSTDFAAGKALYKQNCAACHGDDGQGVAGIYPGLDGNTLVTAPTSADAVRTVLLGGFPPSTKANPEPYSMPPFAHSLSDGQIAEVVTYVRQAWSNKAGAVDAATVRKARYLPND